MVKTKNEALKKILLFFLCAVMIAAWVPSVFVYATGGTGDEAVVSDDSEEAESDSVEIEDNAVPEAEPFVEIMDPAPPRAIGEWAVVNLISAALTSLGATFALFRKKEEDYEVEGGQVDNSGDEAKEDSRGRKMFAAKTAGVLAGIAAPVTFFLTEDMRLSMALTDKWTPLMLVMLAAQIAAAAANNKASRRKR